MINRIYKIFFTALVCLLIPLNTFAHPGRTDSKGCHKCNADNTNCASWGLNDYEYHCHSGNTYTNSKGQVFNSDGTKISDGNSSTNTPTVPSTPSTPTTPPATEDDTTNNEPVTPPSTNNNTNNNSNGGTSSSGSSSSGSTSTTKPSSGSSSSNITSDNRDVEEEKDKIEEEEGKSNDTSIKSIKVNGKSVDVVDNMYAETIKRSLTLKITVTDKNAKVDYELRELEMGDNEFIIKVIAEDGTEKEYKLTVKRIEGKGTATITELTLGSNEVYFENNKAKVSILKGESISEYTYKLSNTDAQLKLYINDKEVERIDKLKDGDILTLITIDEDNNELEYEVVIEEMGAIESAIFNIIVYTFVIAFFAGPIAVIIFIIKFNKKKVKN